MKQNSKEKFLYALAVKPINTMSSEEIIDIAKTDNASNIPENIYKNIPDNLDLVFSTYKKYEAKKVRFNKDEIYVGNLDRYLTYDDIYQFLSQFGQVADLKLNYSFKGSDKSNRKNSKKFFAGNSFVKYKDLNVHDKLIAFSNQYSIRGRKVIFSEKVEKIQSIEDIEKSCWFCFGNPNIEKDLILFDLKNFYIAYPKGPIDNYHLIVAPKFHIKNFLSIPNDLFEELEYIVKVLKKFYIDNNLEFIIFEKNLPYNDEKAKHMILNIVGIKKEFSFEIFNKAFDYLKRNKLNYESHAADEWGLIDLKNENNNEIYYHYLDIPVGFSTGKNEKRSKFLIFHEDKRSFNPANKIDFSDYARIIICDIIDKKENVNWKVYFYLTKKFFNY